jgi:hypothetical protein
MSLSERQKDALIAARSGPLFAKGRTFRRTGGVSAGAATIRSLVEAGLLKEGQTRFGKMMVSITDAGLDALGVRSRFTCSAPQVFANHADEDGAPRSLHDRIAP